jgi:ribosome-binding factor A
MANPRRILRLQQLILEVAAQALQREARDDRLEMVSLTRVKLSADLTHASLWWSCLAHDAQRKKIERALTGILPLIQRRVAEALHTRVTPRLELTFDPTLEKAQRLETIFQHLAEERGEPEEDEEDTGDAEGVASEDAAG